jgi:hypothetical protein
MEGIEIWREKFARGMVRNFAPPDFPVIVCLCGSTRFYEAFQKANYDETMAGRIVLSVGFYMRSAAITGHGEGVGHDSEQKVALDELHFRKIELADETFVLNVGGYVGSSTRREVLHAARLGKKVRWLEPFNVPADLDEIGNSLSGDGNRGDDPDYAGA